VITEDCDRCGKVVRVRLDRDVQICGACSAQVTFRPEVAQRIAAARSALLSMDLRSRQLTARQRNAVEGSSLWMVLVLGAVVVACLPFGGCTTFAIFTDDVHPDDRMFLVGTFGAPLVVMAVLGATVVYAFRRAHRKLLGACAALPPATPGDPAACHVCGAPLAGARGAVARCSFCSADNVVSADVMARARHVHARGAFDVEAAVRREAASVGRLSSVLLLLTIVAVFIVPIGLGIADVMIFFACRDWERPLDDDIEYATVDTLDGRCVRRTKGATVYAGPGLGWKPVAPRSTFRASSLVGKRVRPRNGSSTHTYAAVTKVTSSPFYGNMARSTTRTPRSSAAASKSRASASRPNALRSACEP
jgi:hypothetical protein